MLSKTGEQIMKWFQCVILFIIKMMKKFSDIGRNTVSQYPKLLVLFSQTLDTDLKNFIIKANILVDKNGNKQIQILTKNGWEMLDISFLDEVQNLLGSKCYFIHLDDVAEMLSAFQESLNNFVSQAKNSFSSANKKNKF